MKILVVGNGGREHALVWKIRQSPMVTEVYCAPGNAGIAEIADCIPIEASSIVELADFAQTIKADLSRHLAGDYSPAIRPKVAQDDDGVFGNIFSGDTSGKEYKARLPVDNRDD